MEADDVKLNDYFSGHAKDYAAYRPKYPTALIKYICSLIPYRGVAWDCACGNGQLAIALSEYFHLVMASDISREQIANAPGNRGVFYTLQPAEKTDFPDEYFDLIIIGQALHWFDFDAFYKEVGRVLSPNGFIVAIAYGMFRVNPEFDAVINHLYEVILEHYWPPERKHVDRSYKTIPWPFEVVPFPDFEIKCKWDFAQLMGYLNTWSAVKAFEKSNQTNPLLGIASDLEKAWGSEIYREITFPLIIKTGKKTGKA